MKSTKSQVLAAYVRDDSRSRAGLRRDNMVRILEGQLSKKSPRGMWGAKMWQNRFFILYTDELQYFKKAANAEPVGALRLQDIDAIVHHAEKKSGRRFDIRLSGTERRFCLLAPSSTIALRWVNALQVAIQGLVGGDTRTALLHRASTGTAKKYWKKQKEGKRKNTNARSKSKSGIPTGQQQSSGRLSAPVLSSVSKLLESRTRLEGQKGFLKAFLYPRGEYCSSRHGQGHGQDRVILLEARFPDSTSGVDASALGSASTYVGGPYLLHVFFMQSEPTHDDKAYALALAEAGAVAMRAAIPGALRVIERCENPRGDSFTDSTGAEIQTMWSLFRFPSQGSLLSHLRRLGKIPESTVISVAKTLIDTIAKSHARGLRAIIFPETVHIDKNGDLCVVDPWLFWKIRPRELTDVFSYPLEYKTPEGLETGIDPPASDWWRLGVLLYEITVGLPPWRASNAADLKQQISKQISVGDLSFPFHVDKRICAIIRRLLCPIRNRSDDQDMLRDLNNTPILLFLQTHKEAYVVPHSPKHPPKTGRYLGHFDTKNASLDGMSLLESLDLPTGDSISKRAKLFSMTVKIVRGDGFRVDIHADSALSGGKDAKLTNHTSKSMPETTQLVCEVSHRGQTAKATSKADTGVPRPSFDTECQFPLGDPSAAVSIKVFLGRTPARRASVAWVNVGSVIIQVGEILEEFGGLGQAMERWYEVVGPNIVTAGRLLVSVALHRRLRLQYETADKITPMLLQTAAESVPWTRSEPKSHVGTSTVIEGSIGSGKLGKLPPLMSLALSSSDDVKRGVSITNSDMMGSSIHTTDDIQRPIPDPSTGYGIDASYITSRILAVPLPFTPTPVGSAEARAERAKIDAVQKMFKEQHQDKVLLCDLRQAQTSVNSPVNSIVPTERYLQLPIPRRAVPPLEALVETCQKMVAFLNSDSSHVVAVACETGKEPTRLVIVSLLLATKTCVTIRDAVMTFGARRTADVISPHIPSQSRYLGYMAKIFSAPRSLRTLQFSKSLRLYHVRALLRGATYRVQPTFSVSNVKQRIVYSVSAAGDRSLKEWAIEEKRGTVNSRDHIHAIDIRCDKILRGDVRFQVDFSPNSDLLDDAVSFWANIGCVQGCYLYLNKIELDTSATADLKTSRRKCSSVDRVIDGDISIELFFQTM